VGLDFFEMFKMSFPLLIIPKYEVDNKVFKEIDIIMIDMIYTITHGKLIPVMNYY